jgi:ribosome-associated toxin RatA of RatAB toxin-antitoxin module
MQAGKPRSTLKLLSVVSLLLVVGSAASASVEPPPPVDVRPEPSGGLRATATVRLPVSPSMVQQVLTDYERWPSLFSVSMRVASVERRADRVLVDLYITHPFLFFLENRLYSESRELPQGGLVTSLVDGDFKQYRRVWKLTPDGNPPGTRAEFDLLVEADTWAPDWLVAYELRHQLKKHFSLLQRTVLERAGGR